MGIQGESDRSSLPQHLEASWTAEESKNFQSSSVSREKQDKRRQLNLGYTAPTTQMMRKN